VLGACDTFRAAAADQLEIWARRAGCEIVRGAAGADPASVAHDACQRALARGIDVLIVDTAGRLHTQTHLMRELEKIKSVILTKLDGTAKGGVVVAVRQTMKLPIKFIGVGEALDDLQPFDADTFVESLFA
jgi:fused signal recognition particle receptor